MSIEHKTCFFVGIKISDFPFSEISDEKIDDLTDDYF